MLVGTHFYTLDDKGRIRLTQDLAANLDGTITLCRGQAAGNPHGPLWLMPESEWTSLNAKLSEGSIIDRQSLALRRFFHGSAWRTQLDNQNRLQIPARLRTLAKIDSEVVAVGVGTHVELWSREIWETYDGAVTPEMIEDYARERLK